MSRTPPSTSGDLAPIRVLILGGSSEATSLAAALAGCPHVTATLSLAGRTAVPARSPLPTRVGGFGGAGGLAAFIRAQAVEILVDATHPFAARMSSNAVEASRSAGCWLVRVTRPAWAPAPGDRWTEVATMQDAAAALGPAPRRVFLTVGRLQLAAFAAAPQHHYLVRTINPVGPDGGLADATYIAARGPFDAEGEAALMHCAGIDVLVTKNSGGAAAAGKLEAARRLGLPVILVRRPAPDDGALDVAGALAVILAHRAHRVPTPRGV